MFLNFLPMGKHIWEHFNNLLFIFNVKSFRAQLITLGNAQRLVCGRKKISIIFQQAEKLASMSVLVLKKFSQRLERSVGVGQMRENQ